MKNIGVIGLDATGKFHEAVVEQTRERGITIIKEPIGSESPFVITDTPKIDDPEIHIINERKKLINLPPTRAERRKKERELKKRKR